MGLDQLFAAGVSRVVAGTCKHRVASLDSGQLKTAILGGRIHHNSSIKALAVTSPQTTKRTDFHITVLTLQT